ncbi:hypothetical protein ABH931_004218 [Streptacidiphilus sp. MAP12-33]|uniref:MarR family transcriptional regulator n=1 Tax=Streptacidiphilus sp. MAP12-33 TaxID=3156266 RepID=UPI0035131D91
MTRALPQAVVAALTAQSGAGATGTLSASGDPGGLLRLHGGRVVGVESPGAPGVEALLLRSGRVLEASWVAAYQAGAAHGRLAIELVRRGLVGAAELEAVCLMALFDAAFAVAAGAVDDCRWEPAEPPVAGPGPDPSGGFGAAGGAGRESWTWGVARVEVEQVCAETARRLTAFAELTAPVRPGKDRLVAVTDVGAGPVAPGGSGSWAAAPGWGGAGLRATSGLRREVLGLADGRRTARDIAFMLGRGVYPVAVEASRLVADGLLRIGGAHHEGGEVRALLAPRHAAPPPVSPAVPADPPGGATSGGPGPSGPVVLPRRPSRASRS